MDNGVMEEGAWMVGLKGSRVMEKGTLYPPQKGLTKGKNRRIKTNEEGLVEVEGWIALADRDKTYHLKAHRK